MEHKISFADRLRELMDEKGLNQRQLEKETGLSNQAISFWLSEQRFPSIKSMWDLADYFNCSVDYLIGRKEFE